MRQHGEVLRRWQAGQGARKIGRDTGTNRKTASRYIGRAVKLGLSKDLLILDDFALEAMSKEESKDVYQLFLERTRRASMVVTTNRDTAEWISMFDDILLAQCAVGRFKNSAYDFVMEGKSYRPRLKPQLNNEDPPPKTPAQKPQRHPHSRSRRR